MMDRRALLTVGGAAAGLALLGSAPAAGAAPATTQSGPAERRAGVYPDVADTSHASKRAVAFFRSYYTAKDLRDSDAFMEHYLRSQVGYYDGVLGGSVVVTDWTIMKEANTQAMSSWAPGALAYPLRIFGDTNSAIVHFVDTPEMFGAEIRGLSTFDFKDGRITRQVDYWDGRRNPFITGRAPVDQYPRTLGVEKVRQNASPAIDRVARQLGAAMGAGDAAQSAALFSADAVFEDLTTRAGLEGRLAIGRYLQRALPQLPYGPGAVVRHVLGSAQGGGYEWVVNGRPELSGVTALELDSVGRITRLNTVWDGSRLSDSAMRSLAALSIED
jgi:hypothetical protein